MSSGTGWWGRARQRQGGEGQEPTPGTPPQRTAALPVPTAPPAVAQPVPTRAQQPSPRPVSDAGADVMRRRRQADEQVTSLRNFERRLTGQLRAAQAGNRKDSFREIQSRRLAVRARLEEATRRRDALRELEDHLVGDPPTVPTVPAAGVRVSS